MGVSATQARVRAGRAQPQDVPGAVVRARDPYSGAIEDLRLIGERIAELRDGDALARAHIHMEERMNLIELEIGRLHDEIAATPERAVEAMMAALKQANLLKDPSEEVRTLDE